MKIVLSRKGFDSSCGGMPSPILPDGTLLSLPIPQAEAMDSFSGLTWDGKTFEQIIHELRTKKALDRKYCHLDPDLRREVKPRPRSWKPAFGQRGAALSHLIEKGAAEPGTIFLFFGWFRKTEYRSGKLAFVRKAPNLHVLWGFMEVETLCRTAAQARREGVAWHPHFVEDFGDLNGIFVAKKSLSLDPELPGAGTFRFHQTLVLTKKGKSRSRWNLPTFFRNREISYHSPGCWHDDFFQSTARGQEFVLDANAQIKKWVLAKIRVGIGK